MTLCHPNQSNKASSVRTLMRLRRVWIRMASLGKGFWADGFDFVLWCFAENQSNKASRVRTLMRSRRVWIRMASLGMGFWSDGFDFVLWCFAENQSNQQFSEIEELLVSDIKEWKVLVVELEGMFAEVEANYSQNLMLLASHSRNMKSLLSNSPKLVHLSLEDIWSQIIGCAVSILQLCHMGLLLEKVTRWIQRTVCFNEDLVNQVLV